MTQSLFNKLNHESLYLQHVDNILKKSIETLTKYFKNQSILNILISNNRENKSIHKIQSRHSFYLMKISSLLIKIYFFQFFSNFIPREGWGFESSTKLLSPPATINDSIYTCPSSRNLLDH